VSQPSASSSTPISTRSIASVEQRDRPELEGKPVVVGGASGAAS
jgi:nucleotidyltransferase/DNA polymerase involved in DNA repair